MIPFAYNEINDWDDLVIELPDKKIIGGKFTSMRIDRNTIPEGLHAYDVRHADFDTDNFICFIKDFILVNHFGTFVTPETIEGSDEGRPVIDYSFCPLEEYDA